MALRRCRTRFPTDEIRRCLCAGSAHTAVFVTSMVTTLVSTRLRNRVAANGPSANRHLETKRVGTTGNDASSTLTHARASHCPCDALAAVRYPRPHRVSAPPMHCN